MKSEGDKPEKTLENNNRGKDDEPGKKETDENSESIHETAETSELRMKGEWDTEGGSKGSNERD